MAMPQYTLTWGALNYLSYFSRISTWAAFEQSPLALTIVPSNPLQNPLETGTYCNICTEIARTNYLTVQEKDGAYWAYWVNSQNDATYWQLFIDADRTTGKTIPMGCSTVQVYSSGSAYGPGYITGAESNYVGFSNAPSSQACLLTIAAYGD